MILWLFLRHQADPEAPATSRKNIPGEGVPRRSPGGPNRARDSALPVTVAYINIRTPISLWGRTLAVTLKPQKLHL